MAGLLGGLDGEEIDGWLGGQCGCMAGLLGGLVGGEMNG